MAKLAELRKKAKDMGIAAAVIRRATTASELQSVIDDHGSHDRPRKKGAVKKAAVKKAVRKSSAAKKSPARKASGNSGRKASTPAKSKGKAKRSSASSYEPKGGRNLLSKVNFSKTDGWNPREGSAPDRIVKALKRFKGDRTKVFDHLKGDVWDFVQKTKSNGEKRTKADALEMLRYRISRTAWDFAMRTGQHEAADNRVEYGTGGTGNGNFKPAKAKKSSAKKSGAQSRSKPAAKRGRPVGSKNRAKAQKPAQKRGKASTRKVTRGRTRGRGRPKAGSRR